MKLMASNYLAQLYWGKDPNQTLMFGEKALEMAQKQQNNEQLSYAYLNLCQGYLYKDDYAEALDFGLKCLELRQQSDDLPALAFILRTIGWLYYDMENSDLSLKYHKESLKLYEQLEEIDRIGNALNGLGLVYMQKENYQTALSYLERALEIEESSKNDHRVSVVLSNMGACYQKLGSNQQAIDYLRRSLVLNQRFDDMDLFSESLNRMANAFLDLKNYEEAQILLDSASRIINSATLADKKVLMMENLQAQSILYAAQQNYKKSLDAIQEYTDLRESILSEEKSYALMELRVGYEKQRREAEIQLLEQEKQLSNIRRNMLIGGLVGLLLVVLLIVGRLRSSYRKNKLILETKQALTDAELEKSKLTQEQLKNELEFKNKELTTFGMHIAQKNELFNEFIQSLAQIEKADFDKSHVDAAVKSFKHRLDINQDLEEFYTHTELVHQDFLFKLSEKFPDLTDHDKKLSSQIRLNLSNKEIAALNNVSLKSVEVGRSRLRKKMDIDSTVNFSEFLQNI
ncbi:Tetratricopeptide repeat-containing protein [Reichenbachiella faecimaris]|uniref:Tetratricopeptide repeat-containing protein n=2 Tax=Reichenbachiella faecimaris TaxID=692418 RepID=A0A1W2GKA4_REIFA|nr:Tetratricopeptide repeat-containing protein [Reichenbachiella faecimaris]